MDDGGRVQNERTGKKSVAKESECFSARVCVCKRVCASTCVCVYSQGWEVVLGAGV